MVHFEVTDVIRTVKYCNFSSYIMKLQYLKCILTRFFFSKIKVEKPHFSYEIYQSASQCSGVFARQKKCTRQIAYINFSDNFTIQLALCFFIFFSNVLKKLWNPVKQIMLVLSMCFNPDIIQIFLRFYPHFIQIPV